VTRPKAKGLVIQEQEQASTPITSSKDKGKGIMVEEPLKMKKKYEVLFDEQEVIRLQAQFDEEERIAREKEEVNVALIAQWNDIQDKVETDYELAQRLQAEEQEELTNEEKSKHKTREESSFKRAGDELEQEPSKKQKVDDDKETKELKQCMEIISDDGDDVTIEATPLSTKSPTIFDYKIYKEGTKIYFQIIRADVHCVTMQNILYYLLVEKMYPLTKHTLYQMFNDVKLQVDYKYEMAFELLRLVKKHLKEGYERIVGMKSLLEVTAVKLVLLVPKLLLLVLKVNVAGNVFDDGDGGVVVRQPRQ
ncbi:hypothetical protein Tco_1234377, partial [Tanacetum coccineum]